MSGPNRIPEERQTFPHVAETTIGAWSSEPGSKRAEAVLIRFTGHDGSRMGHLLSTPDEVDEVIDKLRRMKAYVWPGAR